MAIRKYGESGIEVSDYFPRIGANVDQLAIVRSMWTTDSNHGAQTQFHSGRHMNDGQFPTLGAWVHYGLGTLNENLPQFISIGSAALLEHAETASTWVRHTTPCRSTSIRRIRSTSARRSASSRPTPARSEST